MECMGGFCGWGFDGNCCLGDVELFDLVFVVLNFV